MKGGFLFMKKITLEEFIKERVKENKELFSKKELTNIEENIILIKKIYILALINSKDVNK